MHDYCLYTRIRPNDEIYIVLYVDDLLIAIIILKKQLMLIFAMSDCGEASHFLGIELSYSTENNTLRLSQVTNVEKLLARYQMSECNSVKTPMDIGMLLSSGGDETTDEPYREMLGTVMYIMLCTRPDVCFPLAFRDVSSKIHSHLTGSA